MGRDGTNPRPLYSASGRDAHDATWSPDGSKILFAFGRGENNQLYIMDSSGHDPQLVNESIDTRGHNSWSIDDLIVLDMGDPFMHEIFVMNVDGSNLHQVSEPGNNSQGESFSPDGEWIVSAPIPTSRTGTHPAVRSTLYAPTGPMCVVSQRTATAITSRVGVIRSYTNRRGNSGKL